MINNDSLIGILWMGGKSRRFQESNSNPSSISYESKIYAFLYNKPLFSWVLTSLESVVDRCVLSFHSSLQYDHFLAFINQHSLYLPNYKYILDSPIILSQGPIHAQLTALRKYREVSKILSISADMPFILSNVLKSLQSEPTAISTLQSSNNVIEPLVSAFTVRKCKFASNFLSFFHFGRADDLHRGVKTLTLYTVSSDYPSRKTPWNKNINYKNDIEELNQELGPISDEYSLISDQPFSYTSQKILNSGNDPDLVTDILPKAFNKLSQETEALQLNIYANLFKEKSYFYSGKLAEFLALNLEQGRKQIEWFSKAANSYWNETLFWIKNNVPFLAFHSLKDCHLCLKRSEIQTDWLKDAKLLLKQLTSQLNLSEDRR
ncbi:MAG: molybdenum cofactor guanylyltransferase [Candidatus Hodarchaeales archaeon]|jgi:molybdopterin-guanine dinucleotide biosynthesis protein A